MLIWDMQAGYEGKIHARLFDLNEYIRTITVSADQATIATGGVDRGIYLWDVMQGQICLELVGHNDYVNRLLFHPIDGS